MWLKSSLILHDLNSVWSCYTLSFASSFALSGLCALLRPRLASRFRSPSLSASSASL
jgi:hypothetical protein